MQQNQMQILQNSAQQLIRDINFENGFWIGSLQDGDSALCGKLSTFGEERQPTWTLKQWYSKYNVSDAVKTMSANGNIVSYCSGGKKMEGVNIPAKIIRIDRADQTFYLECNAEAEYDRPRCNREGWPHLLISQDTVCGRIDNCIKLTLSLEYKVTKFQNLLPAEIEDPKLHSAACILYLRLQNFCKSSADFGNYFWLGFRMFDNRYIKKTAPLYAKQDGCKDINTGKFIYNPISDYYLNDAMPDVGESRSVSVNILPAVQDAFACAQSSGHLQNTRCEDLCVSYMNIGWEVTGTYNVAVEVKNISLLYYEKQNKREI